MAIYKNTNFNTFNVELRILNIVAYDDIISDDLYHQLKNEYYTSSSIYLALENLINSKAITSFYKDIDGKQIFCYKLSKKLLTV